MEWQKLVTHLPSVAKGWVSLRFVSSSSLFSAIAILERIVPTQTATVIVGNSLQKRALRDCGTQHISFQSSFSLPVLVPSLPQQAVMFWIILKSSL